MDRQQNPDENPLYNKDGNAFTDALIDHWESKQSVPGQNDTHALFVTDVSGTPKVLEIDSDEYNELSKRTKAYMTGTKESCEVVAQDIWETIADENVHGKRTL
jgi:hypothetical protein